MKTTLIMHVNAVVVYGALPIHHLYSFEYKTCMVYVDKKKHFMVTNNYFYISRIQNKPPQSSTILYSSMRHI